MTTLNQQNLHLLAERGIYELATAGIRVTLEDLQDDYVSSHIYLEGASALLSDNLQAMRNIHIELRKCDTSYRQAYTHLLEELEKETELLRRYTLRFSFRKMTSL